jgi:CubicO group peptidase (beta-lactamase class C family)
MLVNDQENHAHQGLARFRYRSGAVRDLQFQFVQQTSPYLLRQLFLAWGLAPIACEPLRAVVDLEASRAAARRELEARLPSRPWSSLVAEGLAGAVGDLGASLDPQWVVTTALVRRSESVQPAGAGAALYYQESATPCGPYPYPLEMRFGVRSIMKSIAAPLTLLRLAAVYGPQVLSLRVGEYVDGLHAKYNEVRLIDAANMASGFGGTGSSRIQPNEFEDGYLEADYDGWYTAPSHEEKLAHMARWLRPYPWAPGAALRYRDQDFYVLGVALDGFLKAMRGADAEVWDMLVAEVFAPIGINAAPTTRTREASGRRGKVWFNAGYFPTLDDLAKISLLYQNRGAWGGRQILHEELTTQLLAAHGALSKRDGSSLQLITPQLPEAAAGGGSSHYRMGFHFTPGEDPVLRERCYLPTMWGSGESEIRLYPSGQVTIRIGKFHRL